MKKSRLWPLQLIYLMPACIYNSVVFIESLMQLKDFLLASYWRVGHCQFVYFLWLLYNSKIFWQKHMRLRSMIMPPCLPSKSWAAQEILKLSRGHIFSCVRPFCELAVSDLDRSMHTSLWD
jgi:hypothetical protein